MSAKYSRPEKEIAPQKNLECIKCGRIQAVVGTWNTYVGRWYLGFTCPNCETHQSVFVSSAARVSNLKTGKTGKNVKKPYADTADQDEE